MVEKTLKNPKVLVLEKGSLTEMQDALNHYLGNGKWVLIDLKSNYGEFFCGHVAWLARKSYMARIEKVFEGEKK